MLISQKWLQKYIPEINKFTPEEISEALTLSIAEVEVFRKVRFGLDKIVVGEIIQVEAHPGSDHLSKCEVTIDDSNATRTIICGAKNVAAGQKVAVCLPGGSVVSPKNENEFVQIKETEILSILSSGMICSAKELGISNEHSGIMVLEPETPLGTDLAEVLMDIVYEIENKSLSHRSDCFSHIGIARELSAIMKIKFDEQPLEDYPIISAAETNFEVEIKVPDEFCPRFTAIALKDVKVKNSPIWMQSLLSAVGIRPINNIVDVTNYIMFDKGQPLHAYDYDKLNEKKLTIRNAKNKEIANTLDEKSYTLDKEMIVISSGENIEDIAGIMGGSNSEISKDTTNVIYEAANWNMYNIRKTSRALGVRSEASTRYEKGLDPNLAIVGLKSAVKLTTDITDAEISSEIIDIYPNPEVETVVDFDISLVNRLIGIDLSKQQIIDILKSLQFIVLEENTTSDSNINQVGQSQIKIKVPTYRRDIKIKQDLLEEIARLYGYPKILPTLPIRDLTPVSENKFTSFTRKVKHFLVGLGLDEIMTYTFVNQKQYENCNMDINSCLEIKNPLSPDLSHLRNSLLPSLLDKAILNSKSFDNFSVFEIGRIIEMELNEEKIHKQPFKLAILMYDTQKDNLYFDIKGIFERIADLCNVKPEIEDSNQKFFSNTFHQGRVADIKINGEYLGTMGEIHPIVQSKCGLSGRVSALEIDFEMLMKANSDNKVYKPLSAYQEVTRDISFWINKEVKYSEILKAINSLNIEIIKEVKFIDLFYSKEEISKKSITISVLLQSQEKTLIDEEINTTVEAITKALANSLKAELRK